MQHLIVQSCGRTEIGGQAQGHIQASLRKEVVGLVRLWRVLLHRKFTDPAHEDGDKVAWMRMDILRHRYDVLVLQAAKRLLEGGLDEALQPDLVDVLFDYKPELWYRPAVNTSPPELITATPAALDALHDVGVVALTMVRLTDEQRGVVRKRLDQVEKLRGY